MMKEFFAYEDEDIFEIAGMVIRSTGIVRKLKDDPTAENINRLENIGELFNTIKIFSIRTRNNSILDFINEVALDETKEEDKPMNQNYVSLMTIHQSKGLEFPYIYIVGLENGLFPSQKSLNKRNLLEEERRLFYVAITRAIKKVTVSYALNRFRFGTISKTVKSLFINELNYYFVDKVIKQHSYTNCLSESEIPKVNNKKLIKITKSSNSSDGYTRKVKSGQIIIHNIFGKGKIKSVENTDGNQRITVVFNENGEKILLTKFAKFKIII